MLIPATLKDFEKEKDFIPGKTGMEAFKVREFVFRKPNGKEVKARPDRKEIDKGVTSVFLMLGKDNFSTTYVQFNTATGLQKEPHKLFVNVSDKYGVNVVGKQMEPLLPPGMMTEIKKYGGRRKTRRTRGRHRKTYRKI
jgi:hypothetical protein